MICKKCNKKNEKYYNYCIEEGQYLKDNTEKLSTKISQYKYCTACSGEILKESNYCCNCGKPSQSISISQNNIFKNINVNTYINKSNDIEEKLDLNKLNLKNIDFKSVNLKNSFKIAGISIAFSLLLSVISLFIFGILNDEIFMGVELVLGMFVLSHLPKITLDSFYINLEMYIGIIILAMIPIISNYFAGVIGIKEKEESFEQSKISILVIATLYTLILLIVAGITKLVMGSGVGYNISFVSLKLIFNSMIFSGIGFYMAQQRGKNIKRRIEDSLIKMSISTVFQGIILMALIGILVITMMISSNTGQYIMYFMGIDINDTMPTAILYGLTLSPILFGLGNLGSISLSGDGESILKYNILDFNIEGTNMWIYIIALLGIIALFYYLKGRKLRSIVSEDSYRYPLIFSGIYTIVILVLFNVCKIVAGGRFTEIISGIIDTFNYIGMGLPDVYFYNTISISFSLIISLISTFIFSFIFISLGYRSNKK